MILKLKNDHVIYLSKGWQKRDFLYITDAVEGITQTIVNFEKLQGNLTKNKERNDAIELKVSELEETISISEDTIADLSPKVEANEQIVTSLQDSIERDYISKENFLIGQALLNELTTGVTAVQEEKLELQGFLNEIRTEEMRLFELCNKDKKCRNAMADRMGMD